VASVNIKVNGRWARILPPEFVGWCEHCRWGIPYGSGWVLIDCGSSGTRPIHNPDPGCAPYIEAARKQQVPSS
jgi:hypothetical protein